MSRRKRALDLEMRQFARNLRRGATDAERRLWGELRNRRFMGLKFRRQHPAPPYVLDFFCEELGLAVELDGGQHNSDNGRRHDEQREHLLEAQGIRVLRFWNDDALADTEAVLQAIAKCVQQLRELPFPVGGLAETNDQGKFPSPRGRGLG